MAVAEEEARVRLPRVRAGLTLKRRGWLFAALAGALGLGAWWLAERAPESRVRDRVDELAAALRVDEASRASLNTRLAPLLTRDVTLTAPEIGRVEGHAAVLATILRHAIAYDAADLVLRNPTVDVRGPRAFVRTRAAVLEHGDQHFDVQRSVDLVLIDDDGTWRVASIAVGPRDEADPEARP